jgi:methylase of polypeptide subunit release factors
MPKESPRRAARGPSPHKRARRPARAKRTRRAPRGPGRFCANDPDSLAQLRAALAGADYATLAVATRNRNSGTGPASDGHPLIRMFLHAQALDEDSARRALDPLPLEKSAEAGLIALKDGMAEPRVKLAAHQGLVVASDTDWGPAAAAESDVVMGLTSSTLWLAHFTVRRNARLTLDLGTGTGFQAMLAARHSERVIATDLSPRALEFARFNARLNGIPNIEFVEGDLFEPVEGRKFDLVVCNPPFVISPGCEYLYRDNPLDGDAFVERIVREIPRFLAEGGFGQIVCDWAQAAGQPWHLRLVPWCQRTGCDAWVMRAQTKRRESYARSNLKGYEGAELEKAYSDWMAHFERAGVEQIGFGVITLRRASGRPHWFSADEVPPRLPLGAGSDVERGFALRDFLSTRRGDRALLAARLRPPPHLRIEPQLEPKPGGWALQGARLSMTRGLSHARRLDSALTRIVLRCDGRRSMGELLSEVASAQGLSADRLAPGLLSGVRQLVALGFLWPVAGSERRPLRSAWRRAADPGAGGVPAPGVTTIGSEGTSLRREAS